MTWLYDPRYEPPKVTPDIYENNQAVSVSTSGGSQIHDVNGYIQQSSPVIPLSPAGDQILDLSIRDVYEKTGGNAVITILNMAEHQPLVLVMDTIGSDYTLTFSGEAVKWAGGIQPRPTITSGRADLYIFKKFNNTVQGNVVLNYV